ncbi:MAG: AmmeMemoRadiSam system radical SAM enzyme [Chloroflexi bacterium]|nr:MAG: AmmeMemoRadiSam system radical SAM enzyme [Chloroflexota bacterium]
MQEQSLTLAEYLDQLTQPGELYHREKEGAVRCYACAHRCLIRNGRRGICQVRFNRDGVLYVPHGYAAGIQSDPIEKKPFYHVLPGADALTFGMLGCDMHCDYCQNWLTSQALRDPAAGVQPTRVSARQLVDLALRYGAKAVVSSYNEPLITTEWAVDVFKLARKHDLVCGYVSNGNATAQVLDYLKPWIQCYKIDLKTMQDKQYRRLGAVLQNVLDGIRMAYERGFWVEIVTLVVPGFNDSDAELKEMAQFIAGISPEIPWHVTAYHRDYRMTEPPPTTVRHLLRAAEIGKECGLHFVYAGNLPGHVGEFEHTFCPNCRTALIRRRGFYVESYTITPEGACPQCGTSIPGIWHKSPDAVRQSRLGSLFRGPRVVRF